MKKNLLFLSILFILIPFLNSFNNTSLFAGNEFRIKTPSTFFIENKGQWQSEIKYILKSNGTNVLITNEGIIYDSYNSIVLDNENSVSRKGSVIKMNFLEHNKNFEFVEFQQESGYYNYFIGNDPNKWVKRARQYSSIILRNIFDNIDAVMTISDGLPRYDFVVKPGANPDNIKLQFTGADKLSIQNNELNIITPNGKITHSKILAFQNINGTQKTVECKIELKNNIVKFKVGDYDNNSPLIIDPTVFTSFFGGAAEDAITDLKLNSKEQFVVCGYTKSENFKTTPGAYDSIYHYDKDIFVSIFEMDGVSTRLVFSTYIGGSLVDSAAGLDIDMSDNIYIAGATNSSDYPNVRSIGVGYNKEYDAIVTKLSNDGDEVVYSTFIGGSRDDIATAIKVDENSLAYVVGYTTSTNFPTKGTCYQKAHKGMIDGFLVKVTETGSALDFSSYFGGSMDDKIFGLDIDYLGRPVVTGETFSADFPVAPYWIWVWGSQEYIMHSPYDPKFNGVSDAFVAKFNFDASSLDFSSFFGGTNNDRGKAVYALNDNTVYIAGETQKETGDVTFPIKENGYQTNHNGGSDVFVCKLSEIKTTTYMGQTRKYQDLIYSSYLGTNQNEFLSKMMFNSHYNLLFLIGYTNATTFPATFGYESRSAGKNDVFICGLTLPTSDLTISGLFGAANDDYGNSMAIDKRKDIYFAGTTKSTDLKQVNSYQPTYGGGVSDGFITKLAFGEISVTSPMGNEEYCRGNSVSIKWSGTNFSSEDYFNVQMIKGLEGSDWEDLATNVKGFTYSWVIPNEFEPGSDYRFRITSKTGIISEPSNKISVLENPKLNFASHIPENLNLCEDATVTFYGSANGTNLKYQWKLNGKNIEGATDTSYTIKAVKPEHKGNYQLVVTGKCPPEVNSDAFSLDVRPKTAITKEPKDTTIKKNEKITFSVDASGEELKYEWFRNNEKILGQSNKTYTIESVQTIHEGAYKCVVTGICGIAESRSAILIVDTNIVSVNTTNELTDVSLDILYDSFNNDVIYAIYSSKNETNGIVLLYDLNGNIVKNIYDGVLLKESRFTIDANTIYSGVYWLSVETKNGSIVKKVNIIK